MAIVGWRPLLVGWKLLKVSVFRVHPWRTFSHVHVDGSTVRILLAISLQAERGSQERRTTGSPVHWSQEVSRPCTLQGFSSEIPSSCIVDRSKCWAWAQTNPNLESEHKDSTRGKTGCKGHRAKYQHLAILPWLVIDLLGPSTCWACYWMP